MRRLLLAWPLPAAAATDWQSALAPRGPAAEALAGLFWPVTLGLGGIWLLVMLVLGVALLRRPASGPDGRAPHLAVGAATLGTVLVIAGLTAASHFVTRAISEDGPEPLEIEVRGYQWWWRVTYPGGLVTANEIHIPVGRPVRLRLSAEDVIHSFWLPGLAGKQDMIPGRETTLGFTAREPAELRAQCAEFCGLQHAHMALLVVAEPVADFEAWLAAQRRPAEMQAELAEGRRLFEQRPCGACHTVRGSNASGNNGPDLTHLASRRSLAAGMLPMNRGTLAAWIADPQTIKPGSNMPLVPLTGPELQAMTAWLMSLR